MTVTRPVELTVHDLAWAEMAAEESVRISSALGAVLIRIEHIGSTSIPGLLAKPTIDLMPVVTDLAALDQRAEAVRAIGYDWRGEWGLSGRRYCVRESREGRRLFHVHCLASDHPSVESRMAFRDYLRAHAEERRAYELEKLRAARLFPEDTNLYHEAKSAWIEDCERRAVIWARTFPGR